MPATFARFAVARGAVMRSILRPHSHGGEPTLKRHPWSSVLLVLLVGVLCTVVDSTQAASPKNPYDEMQSRFASEVSKLGRQARSAIPLLRLMRNWDEATPAHTTALLEKLTRDRKLPPDRRIYARVMLAEAREQLGLSAPNPHVLDELGFIREFRVIGPFDNEGKAGFDQETPPETARMQVPDLSVSVPGRERPVAWRTYPDVTRFGYVSFDSVFRPNENVCGLAETLVKSDRARALSLWLGGGGAIKAYWNGEPVFRDDAYRGPDPDRSVVMVGAHAGWNRLLVKVCVTDGAWGFYARLGDDKGDIATGLTFDVGAENAANIAPGHGVARLPKAPPAVLSTLEAAVALPAPNAQAIEDLARFLYYTSADDPAERRARQLAKRAAELEPTVARLRLAATISEERGDVMQMTAQAIALAPSDPDALLLHASTVADGPVPEDALAIVARIPKGSTAWVRGQILRASVMRSLALPGTARSILLEATAVIPDTVTALEALAEYAGATHRESEMFELRRRILTVSASHAGVRKALLTDAIERLDNTEALAQLDALHSLSLASPQTLRYLASAYDALKMTDSVLDTFREAIALCPEDATTWVAYGHALLDQGQRDAGADALHKALALRPQDAQTRQLLEQLHPQVRPDEAYATASAEILKKRGLGTDYPSATLHDLTVNTVYENGLGSTFRQLVAQVHNDEGARAWRTYSIQFDPSSQRVDLRLARVVRRDGRVLESVQTFEQPLGESWYRIYYDTRALVVVFPDLEPSDVVELRYRIDDMSHRNLFDDYYGDLHLLQGFVPTAHVEYVLITPKARTFHFSAAPSNITLTRDEKVTETQRIVRLYADNLPPLRSESGMPGMTEISPYIHVSTYQTWQDVGRWYWGLIKDQLYADESLKKTVAELVSGTNDVRTKVQRIQKWVVDHTRYVALEFGIHGFKPYRVPLIVQRGFGDCKDKASLLYTMFREAGIDARIVLVRTRRNGDIGELPASLAVFDHAIAYVPELDLFLDGTAEHSGTTELPPQDQGVTVLLVGPESAELRRTPVLDADLNKRTRVMRVNLQTTGAAELEVDETIAGAEAAGYRERYQAPGTRSERLERSLSSAYPGIKLLSQNFDDLDNLERAVQYSYRAEVPQLARQDGTRLWVPGTGLSDLTRNLARLPTRDYALDLGGTSSYAERRVLRLPPKTKVGTLPIGGEATSEYGRLVVRYSATPTEVVVETELVLSRDRITAAQYPEFRSWVEQADVILRQLIPLEGVAQ